MKSKYIAVPIRKTPVLALRIATLLSFCLAATAQTSAIKGKVESAGTPIAGSTVGLYLAGNSKGAPARLLGSTVTGTAGLFQLSFAPDALPGNGDVLYLIAAGSGANPSGGQSPLALATVLGASAGPDQVVVVNERTTVASAWAMAQFTDGFNMAGSSPGLQNAAATVRNLVNISTGEAGTVLASRPNGLLTSTLPTYNSLANLLSLCVGAPEGAACSQLLSLSAAAGSATPANTLDALVSVAHNPTHNISELYQLSLDSRLYKPNLVKAPNAWTLVLKYVGNGSEFDGPGNMVLDAKGDLWITNNYDGNFVACGGKQIIELTPTGQDALDAPFSGGGINGAGFGITIDPSNHLWVGDFGFKGVGCQSAPPANSVSEFMLDGTALSPSTGYLGAGSITSPQGTQSDFEGNIWIASHSSAGLITEFVHGDPQQVKTFGNLGLNDPFDIAVDANGNLWVTSQGNNKVVSFASDGSHVVSYGEAFGGPFNKPLGIAIDSLGNAWVSNIEGSTITEIDTQGQTHVFQGGGLNGAWGIAVDGNDNIWVPNFIREGLSEFCGAQVQNCPEGLKTGDPITGSTGFTSEGAQRPTGVVIDPSGNLWVTNNWKRDAGLRLDNPGGDGMLEYIGIAGPVKAPRIGPPQQP